MTHTENEKDGSGRFKGELPAGKVGGKFTRDEVDDLTERTTRTRPTRDGVAALTGEAKHAKRRKS